jgi:molybdate transport system regulatory protein
LIEGEFSLGGCLNGRLIILLEAIHSSGSISQAAKQVGMSYKGAWEALDRANNLSPRALIERGVGGAHGGGSRLTDTGVALIRAYASIRMVHERFIEDINKQYEEEALLQQWVRGLYLKSSARNQWAGVIRQIDAGEVSAHVHVDIKGNHPVLVQLTQHSLEQLALAPGQEVVLMVKAPLVLIQPPCDADLMLGQNCLEGRVSHLHEGPVVSTFTLDLDSGLHVVGTVSTQQAKEWNIQPGQTAVAVFDPSSVILATLI